MISIDEMAVFCKKKGFIFTTGDIYGGLSGFFDYGPYGIELKNNIKNVWWKRFVHDREDVVGFDGAIITNPKVWKASGHIYCFEEVLVEDSKTQERFRADHLVEEALNIKADGLSKEDLWKLIQENNILSPNGNPLKEPIQFNLMLSTQIGPTKKDNIAYLRPETAQMIFTQAKLIQETTRLSLPFGIAQIGKAFRNEISPRDFLFRCREFEQMELEFFINSDNPREPEFEDIKINVLTAEEQGSRKKNEMEHKKRSISSLIGKHTTAWNAYWLKEAWQWFAELGINTDNLRLRQHTKDELAHYSCNCYDIEYKFPFGWKEIHGSADRSRYDLEQHQKHSNKKLLLRDDFVQQNVLPKVIEPSQGVDRAFLVFLYDAYNDDKKRGNIVLKLHPKLAPVKVGVFPLVNKLDGEAKKIFGELKKEFVCIYDRSGSVGRRYARADELGIPLCITLDFESLDDKMVTVRDRDTTYQVRVKIKELNQTIKGLLEGKKLESFGKLIKST